MKNELNIQAALFLADITTDDITHISRFGSYTIIYTKNIFYQTEHGLTALNKNLPKNIFFRIHPQHIISLKYMTGVYEKWIITGGYYLPFTKFYLVRLIKELSFQINQQCIFFMDKSKLQKIFKIEKFTAAYQSSGT